jgi:hypothetical protein
MPSIGESVYYRQSSKILRNRRSFNFWVRFGLGVLCAGGGSVWNRVPISVATRATDLEYWVHTSICLAVGGVLAGAGVGAV